MDSWLDMLPQSARERLKEKFKMSEAQYDKLREKVVGPEDIEKEMLWNDVMARLKFAMDSEPGVKEALRQQIEKDVREGGIEAVLSDPNVPPEIKASLERGAFDVAVAAPDESRNDQVVILPEGNVGEKLPVKVSLTSKLMAQLLR